MSSNIFKLIKQLYWTKKTISKFSECGAQLKVTGPIIINNEGEINCGDNLLIRSNFRAARIFVANNTSLIIGNNVFFNNQIHISCSSNIKIGSNCAIADECLIIDNDFHGVGDNLPKKAPIIIEDDVWLATRVIVLKGVTIGKGSVIGAGSIVTKSIPPNSFAAGVPAKVIRSI